MRRGGSIRDWFDDEELEPCPRCEQESALATPQFGMVICIECGVVGFRAAGKGS